MRDVQGKTRDFQLGRVKVVPAKLRTSLPRSLSLYSPSAARGYARIGSSQTLVPAMREVLEDEEAPQHVWRWVAYGRFLEDRAVRIALAKHLRREANKERPGRSDTGWAWPKDAYLGLAERIFRELPQRAELVATGVLVGGAGRPERFHENGWARTWGAIEKSVAAVDLEWFWNEILRRDAERPKASRIRKKVESPPASPEAELRQIGERIRSLERKIDKQIQKIVGKKDKAKV